MFKNIQFYQKVILLLWLGLSAHFAQAVVSLDDQSGTVELPANTSILNPVLASQPCSGTEGSFSFKTSVSLNINPNPPQGNPDSTPNDRMPTWLAFLIRLNLSNGAKFISNEFHPIILRNGNPLPGVTVTKSIGGDQHDFVTFFIESANSDVLFSDTLSFCLNSIQVVNKNPVNLTYSLHQNKDSAEGEIGTTWRNIAKIYERSVRFLTFALHCSTYNVSFPNPPTVSIPCVNAGGTNYQVNMNFISCPSSSFPLCLEVSSATPITLPAGTQCPVAFPTSGTLDGLHLDCLTVTPTESYWVNMKWIPSGLKFGVTNFGQNP